MVSVSLHSLSDLCGIRIAYLMWTRQEVIKECLKEVLFDELVDAVLSNVQSLPFPKRLKSPILKHVNPVGKHLLSVLNLWFSNTMPDNSRKYLTNRMLFECLILNAYGLINQRKTAEKILSNRMLDNVFAFRLACINFLEKEVLKLWPLVNQHFLNKIVLEGEQPHAFIARNFSRKPFEVLSRTESYCFFHNSEYLYSEEFASLPPLPCTTEPDEILFWINYCLSRENKINIMELPHFIGNDVDWYQFSLDCAASSGNVACFDYFHYRKIEYNYMNVIRGIFSSQEKDQQQPCFIFHYLLLSSEEKEVLFRTFPRETYFQFIQWPLSLTFVEQLAVIWNLIPDEVKEWVFYHIFEILFHENILIHPLRHRINYDCLVYSLKCLPIIAGIYSVEHLSEIWIDLWQISSDSNKLSVLTLFVFESIAYSMGRPQFHANFRSSGLKDKLLRLFLSNGETVLEFYKRENMQESLRRLLSKHLPEYYEDIDSKCISFLKTQTEQPEIIRKKMIKARDRILIWRERRNKRNHFYPVHQNFFNYLKKNVLWYRN